ncbi:MAG: hypothetical protein IH807_06260 [Proteobacteria bacterium]|nr:hypothetical protein [Pseudomonadota bacterium]
MEAAFDECSPLIEGIIQNFRDVDASELEDTFLEFAGCMREQGIEMPDPDFSQGFGPGAGGRAGIFGDLDPQDPEFQAAAEECQGIFEGGFGLRGGGAGPGRGPERRRVGETLAGQVEHALDDFRAAPGVSGPGVGRGRGERGRRDAGQRVAVDRQGEDRPLEVVTEARQRQVPGQVREILAEKLKG